MVEVAALEEQAVKRTQILGAEHPNTLTSMNNFGGIYWTQGMMAEAAALHNKVLQKSMQILGADHPNTLISMNNLTETYQAQGRMAEVAALQEEVDKQRQLG